MKRFSNGAKKLIKRSPLAYRCAKKTYHKYNEWVSYAVNIVNPSRSDQVRLIIFGQGRTGSTLLEDLLCSTEYFCSNGELLNTKFYGEVQYPLQYILGMSKRRNKKDFVFHVKIYQLTRDRKRPIDPSVFLSSLYANGWKIIYLRRKNKVKHALSNIIAEQRGVYHKFSNYEERIRISINCRKITKRVKNRFMWDNAEQKAIANIRYHEVIYEDDLEKSDSHQKTVDKILEYVLLEHRAASTKYKKINTQSLQHLIIDYDKFVKCMNKNGWQKFIE